MSRWQPNVTVATVVERAGRFLMVEEAPEAARSPCSISPPAIWSPERD